MSDHASDLPRTRGRLMAMCQGVLLQCAASEMVLPQSCCPEVLLYAAGHAVCEAGKV